MNIEYGDLFLLDGKLYLKLRKGLSVAEPEADSVALGGDIRGQCIKCPERALKAPEWNLIALPKTVELSAPLQQAIELGEELQVMFVDPEAIHVLWSALLAMVEENHSAQDMMTERQWELAEEIFERMTEMVEQD